MKASNKEDILQVVGELKDNMKEPIKLFQLNNGNRRISSHNKRKRTKIAGFDLEKDQLPKKESVRTDFFAVTRSKLPNLENVVQVLFGKSSAFLLVKKPSTVVLASEAIYHKTGGNS